ncbi:MAG: glycine dehydrogenase (aminomethyl-transferring), partial [Verrucomicrobia bacterium]
MFSRETTAERPATETHPPAHEQTEMLKHTDRFVRRHIGPGADDTRQMLSELGHPSLDALADVAVPASIRLNHRLNLPGGRSEFGILNELRSIAAKNQVFRSYIGMGYYDCITPPVIQRNILESPGWYTQYTPYQAEISQGRLEMLLNFQTMICDLTGLEIANASLLDEATAAAEALMMCHRLKHDEGRNILFVSQNGHPQNIEVVQTRARALGINVVVGDHNSFAFGAKVFAALVQYPDTFGAIHDYRSFVEKAHGTGAMVVVAADLLSLALLEPPGEFGADIAVGSAQRFGVPLGYGGPHAAFFATRDAFKRQMPGRLVGVSKDSRGRPALRLSLGTREQHIRREKATSNMCTAQALLASMAAAYAIYHGPAGLRQMARRAHFLANILALGLERLGCGVGQASSLSRDSSHDGKEGRRAKRRRYFDTLRVELGSKRSADIAGIAEAHRINLRVIDATTVGISLDETVTENDLGELLQIFNGDRAPSFTVKDLAAEAETDVPAEFARTSKFLAHPVFNRYHSETEMLRYLKRLESRDLSLTTSMIPLGSCTMKLNATCEMLPVSWPEFSRIHPFAPLRQTQGYQILFKQLEGWLAEIT